MNNLAFQIYGTKKASPFQSVWDTRISGAVGTELASIAATTPLFNWSGTNLLTGGYTHTTGIPGTLLFNSLTPTAGQSYQIVSTLSVGTTGSLVINWGGVSSVPISATTTITLTPINGTSKLSITPSNDFTGNVRLSIKASSSAANQIQLPIGVASGKSIWVDWGDNSYSTMDSINHTANRIHTYSTPGEYTVRILGDNFNFGFGSGNINDRLKLKSISSWGKLKIGASSFNGCSNVTMSGITDIPDLTGVTSLDSTFAGCSAITTVGRMNEWNTSSVTNMYSTFFNAINFNQNIGSWNVSNVGMMHYMFYGAAAFNQSLSNWERIGSTLSSVTNMSFMFAFASNFNNGFASGVANQLPWTINTTAASVLMTNMFQNATAFNSNLGTGTTPWNVSKVTTFASMFQGATNFRNGDEVTQSKINDWNIGGSVTSVNMTSMFSNALVFNRLIDNWNMTKVNNTSGMFYGAAAFNQSLSNWERIGSIMANITNMSSMFAGSNVFNQDISNWNVSGVTNFSTMFFATPLFNNGSDTNTNLITGRIGIDGWNINTTASVNMSSMFAGSGGDTYVTFNRPIGNWNTSRVTNMSNMFGKSGNGNHAFNQYIGDWDTSNVTDMSNMFYAGGYGGTTNAFNQDISKWDVNKVTNFSSMLSTNKFTNGSNLNYNPVTELQGINGWNINTTATSVNMTNMFYRATTFNQPIGSWNVSKVTNMSYMFNGATAFNQPLSNWERVSSPDTSTLANITNMTAMFTSATAFNKNIGNWNVSSVSAFATGDVSGMFYNATNFNNEGSGDIGNWQLKTTGTISMQNMFRGTAFNQNINAWNTVAVNNMKTMFYDARVFNQPLNAWNVSNVTDMSGMFFNTPAFNQPLNNWTTSAVTNMSSMFDSDSVLCGFNQDIGSWNVSNVTNFTRFMFTKTPATFSSTNLDAIYNNTTGWVTRGVKPNITISFGTAKYTSAGVSGRNTLTGASNNWTIVDGGIAA